MDQLTIGLIRSLNAEWISRMHGASDEELIFQFGQAAQPLADAIRTEIREEMSRQLGRTV